MTTTTTGNSDDGHDHCDRDDDDNEDDHDNCDTEDDDCYDHCCYYRAPSVFVAQICVSFLDPFLGSKTRKE